MIVDETKQCVSLFNLDLNRSKLGLKLAVCRLFVECFNVFSVVYQPHTVSVTH